MATDYDTPRKTDDDGSEESLEELKGKQSAKSAIDIDENPLADGAEVSELPGADLSGEELSVRVVPKQADEFTCTECFLVHHRSQLSGDISDKPVCRDCASRLKSRAEKKPVRR